MLGRWDYLNQQVAGAAEEDETRLAYILGFGSRLLSSDGSYHAMLGAVGYFQETSLY